MLGWGVSGEISFPSQDWLLALDATARRRIAEAKACDMRIISNETTDLNWEKRAMTKSTVSRGVPLPEVVPSRSSTTTARFVKSSSACSLAAGRDCDWGVG
jgi:hypothetical protein